MRANFLIGDHEVHIHDVKPDFSSDNWYSIDYGTEEDRYHSLEWEHLYKCPGFEDIDLRHSYSTVFGLDLEKGRTL